MSNEVWRYDLTTEVQIRLRQGRAEMNGKLNNAADVAQKKANRLREIANLLELWSKQWKEQNEKH